MIASPRFALTTSLMEGMQYAHNTHALGAQTPKEQDCFNRWSKYRTTRQTTLSSFFLQAVFFTACSALHCQSPPSSWLYLFKVYIWRLQINMTNNAEARVSVWTPANIITDLNEAGGIEASTSERFWMKIKNLIILCVTVMIVLLMAGRRRWCETKSYGIPHLYLTI